MHLARISTDYRLHTAILVFIFLSILKKKKKDLSTLTQNVFFVWYPCPPQTTAGHFLYWPLGQYVFIAEVNKNSINLWLCLCQHGAEGYKWCSHSFVLTYSKNRQTKMCDSGLKWPVVLLPFLGGYTPEVLKKVWPMVDDQTVTKLWPGFCLSVVLVVGRLGGPRKNIIHPRLRADGGPYSAVRTGRWVSTEPPEKKPLFAGSGASRPPLNKLVYKRKNVFQQRWVEWPKIVIKYEYCSK